MYFIVGPIVVAATKVLVKKAVSEAVSEGISKARYEVEKRITKSLVSSLFNIIINVVSLMVVIYVVPIWADSEVVVYLVCSVYLGSILYGIYSIVVSYPLMLSFVFEHKFSLKEYVYREVYWEARSQAGYEIGRRNIIARALNGIFGMSASDIASSIAYATTRLVIKKVLSIVLVLSTIFLVYVLVFRIMVAPVLIESTTHLNMFKAALYPIFYSIDYFFDTTILSWLLSM
jgi:hypothetical protein